MATPTNMWLAPSPHSVAQPAGGDEMGLQTRPMGLKVHYTFDRDNMINCLARWPNILHIQTIPLDERNSIGVVDLRTCLQAVAQCSPEIVNQHDTDYSVYAYDYSEPDMPLVGQGMLSWGLDSSEQMHDSDQQPPKLVTGRVTRNLLAILSNGSRETLEVKLKLTAVQKMIHRTDFSAIDGLPSAKSSLIHADASSEWNSFIQSTSIFGHTSNVPSMPSPSIPPATHINHFNASMTEARPMETRSEIRHESGPSRSGSVPPHPPRPSSNPMPPQAPASQPKSTSAPSPAPVAANTQAENAPSPAAPQPAEAAAPAPASRSNSRARRRNSRVPTGKPRGRPRKQGGEANTSAAEDFTDGDEAPQKKRAKVTKAEYNPTAPFGSAPDSLRVAASTSGSLRSMRPVGSGNGGSSQSHLQEVPRAPTPVPDGATLEQLQRRWLLEHNARKEAERLAKQSRQQSREARSPAESFAPSPDQAYTPEDSPAGDLGSSPPVPRTTAYMRSSPPASSPILPPMPMPQMDSGFMSGGLDDFFDDDDIMQDFPPPQMSELPGPISGLTVSAAQPVRAAPGKVKSRKERPKASDNFSFQEVTPGPPELLPQTSLFKPAGKVLALNRPSPAPSNQPAPKKSSSRSLKRSNTAPIRMVAEPELPAEETQTTQQLDMNMDLSEEHADLRQLQEHLALVDAAPPATSELKEEAANGMAPASHSVHTHPQPETVSAVVTTAGSIPERPEPLFSIPPRPVSRPVSRPPSRSLQRPVVPASDPVPEPAVTLPASFMSEVPCPTSDFEPRYNKNMVKKQSIKERLEAAIEKGESPPFCNNCGAIETPTWRKIWTQDHKGVPGFHEFSDKPGFVTMIDILERDSDGKPLAYRLVKKNLGSQDDKKKWTEMLLCNPCGIWLAKFKTHRPPDRWDKDAARLNQPRKRREPKGSRAKKPRTKSDTQMNPTSEAYFTTDPLGPMDQESPEDNDAENEMLSQQPTMARFEETILNLQGSPKQRLPGSTHSRGSGTADSPIAVENDLGSTRRLLFPSPKRDGAPRVLGELAVNVLQPVMSAQAAKSAGSGKENNKPERHGTPVHNELDLELFGTPPDRPSTPPQKSAGPGPFKTPTRPTPSHRPITRSISKSMQSAKSIPKSPSQLFAHLQGTPSRTPRSGAHSLLSASKRRSPRNGQLHAHFAPQDNLESMQYSPFTATLHKLLSEANDFTAGSPSHGLPDIDISNLPQLDSDTLNHLAHSSSLDFGNFLSTDMMPSSPPLLRHRGTGANSAGGGMDFSDTLGP